MSRKRKAYPVGAILTSLEAAPDGVAGRLLARLVEATEGQVYWLDASGQEPADAPFVKSIQPHELLAEVAQVVADWRPTHQRLVWLDDSLEPTDAELEELLAGAPLVASGREAWPLPLAFERDLPDLLDGPLLDLELGPYAALDAALRLERVAGGSARLTRDDPAPLGWWASWPPLAISRAKNRVKLRHGRLLDQELRMEDPDAV